MATAGPGTNDQTQLSDVVTSQETLADPLLPRGQGKQPLSKSV